jgi:hypothetical protein
MKPHNHRTLLRLEQLERRDAPSSMLVSGLTIAPVSSANGPVADVRLRRIVTDVATTGGPTVTSQPMESLSLNS